MRSASAPEFFIDRSLGRYVVPRALREAGATVLTMAEIYGERVGQELTDEEWLHDAGENGWVVLMKDAKIRYRPAELEAVRSFDVRAFCLANANLGGEEQATRLVANLSRITLASVAPGPYIYGVYVDAVRKLWPPG